MFHAEWERRAAALSLAMNATGTWNIDMVRHARERIPPAEYLAASYYEKWLKGLERLLVERGLATQAEIDAGHGSLRAARPAPEGCGSGCLCDAREGLLLRAAAHRSCPLQGRRPRAREGDEPAGHTRLPRYVRGHKGRIARIHGVHVFPDANATGKGEDPRWLYSVAFDAREVWGPEATAGRQRLPRSLGALS